MSGASRCAFCPRPFSPAAAGPQRSIVAKDEWECCIVLQMLTPFTLLQGAMSHCPFSHAWSGHERFPHRSFNKRKSRALL
jgi:hypothetical protein